jgi:hypothetical protein
VVARSRSALRDFPRRVAALIVAARWLLRRFAAVARCCCGVLRCVAVAAGWPRWLRRRLAAARWLRLGFACCGSGGCGCSPPRRRRRRPCRRLLPRVRPLLVRPPLRPLRPSLPGCRRPRHPSLGSSGSLTD